MYCIKCGAPLKYPVRFCPMCGEPILSGYDSFEKQPAAGRRQIYTYENHAPMKWFKFVIWVQLFLTAFVSLGCACGYLSGMYSKINTGYHMPYSYFRGLRLLDIIIGIIYLLLAAADIYTRFQLSGFKRIAPRLYIYLLIFNMVIPMLYLVLFHLIVLSKLIVTPTMIVTVVIDGIMIALNIIYFKKREHLFVN
ncbi:MAG: hypothetical protein LUD07_10870 [Clostridiales bacterium]|nr:hypothetical protein [Clostridiales bacterium]